MGEEETLLEEWNYGKKNERNILPALSVLDHFQARSLPGRQRSDRLTTKDSKKGLGLGAPWGSHWRSSDARAVQESHHPGLEATLLPGCFSPILNSELLNGKTLHRLDL